MIYSKQDLIDYIKKDELANERLISFNKWSIFQQLLFPDYIWQFQKALRYYEYCFNTRKGFISKLRLLIAYRKYKKYSLKVGFSIPKNVFEEGLSIPHYGTIVVNSNCSIGRNCRLHVGVNIGASGGSNKAPKIGNNVYIGPGAIIFGDITIADNVTIAANATVNKSVRISNCVVAGSPATIVKANTRPWNEGH